MLKISENLSSCINSLKCCKLLIYASNVSITFSLFCLKIGVHIAGELFAKRTVSYIDYKKKQKLRKKYKISKNTLVLLSVANCSLLVKTFETLSILRVLKYPKLVMSVTSSGRSSISKTIKYL